MRQRERGEREKESHRARMSMRRLRKRGRERGREKKERDREKKYREKEGRREIVSVLVCVFRRQIKIVFLPNQIKICLLRTGPFHSFFLFDFTDEHLISNQA